MATTYYVLLLLLLPVLRICHLTSCDDVNVLVVASDLCPDWVGCVAQTASPTLDADATADGRIAV